MRGLSCCLLLALAGCSARGGYYGMQETARMQCQKNPDTAEARRCEQELARHPYDDYQRDRPQ